MTSWRRLAIGLVGSAALGTAAVWAALLGVAPGVPTTQFSNPGSTTYNASTHVFSVTATPTYEAFGSPVGTKAISSPRALTIDIQVDDTGALIGGVAGNDLTLTGTIAGTAYSGVLLTGEIVAFGYQNIGTTDMYDFRFHVSGGALAGLYGTNDIGIRMQSENSTFSGSFRSNFSGLAKGVVGPIAQLPARLGDFVWEDLDRDGIQDAGEPGIPNVEVWLKDAGNNIIGTTTTDANGIYAFNNLAPGSYWVEYNPATIPAGLLPSPTNQGGNPAADSDVSPVGVTLAAGDVNLTLDFGFYPPCTGTIGDIVWNDLDRDGIQDAGEPGINGVTVQLLDGALNVIASATTAANGSQLGYYQFSGLCAGVYYVQVDQTTLPPGMNASPTEVGTDRAIDSNPQQTMVSLTTDSSSDQTIDFGYNLPCSGTIGNFVWNDLDRDGIQDVGETGIDGVTVWLKNPLDDSILQTTTTASGGFYQFFGLCAGDYKVEVDTATVPAGLLPSPTLQGGDTTADSNPNGGIVNLPIDSWSDLTIDFGFYPPCNGSIGDLVWNDYDRDGIQDAGEPGMAGITVELTDPNTHAVLQTTTTGAGGIYMFNGLCAGTYEVRVDETTLPPGFVPSPSLQGGDTTTDSNGSPTTVTLTTDSSTDTSIDFGYNTPCSGTIGDFVWLDTNADGIQDPGEGGIDNVTVYLYDASHVRIQTAITSGGGAYLFTGVCAGSYTVEVEPTTIPDNLLPSPTGEGGDATKDSNVMPAAVTLPTDSSSDLTIDFGYYPMVPDIQIIKYTNGEDADTPTGPLIPIGGVVTWTYVVTNTGNVELTNVSVTDDQGVVVTCPKTTLAVDEVMTCTATGTAIAGQYANVGTVTGNPPSGPPVTDTNPSHYFGEAPAIDIVKYTNGFDADDPPGPLVPIGSTVTWTYVVTNTGNVPLTNVTVTDDHGVSVTCPKTTLAVLEVMTCTATGTAIAGQYGNVGTATGNPPVGPPVTDTNPSHYYGAGPGIGLTKSAEPTLAAPFQPVTFTYTVTNTGATTLTNVVVRDDNGTPGSPGDDFIVGTVASLAPGASATLTATKIPIVHTQTTTTTIPVVAGTIVTTILPSGDLQVTYVQSFGINDNTYGTGAIGWPSGHTFGNLTGSDKLEFRFTDKNGNVVLDFYQDYISAVTVSPTYPSGYASLCASGGDGSMISGNVANIVSCTSSLADNLNNPLNLANKASLIVNSPTSLVGGNVVVDTTKAPGGWDYINRYTVVIAGSTFGPDGVANFGGVSVPDQHNSPSKVGINSITTEVIDSSVTNTATVFVDSNSNQLPDAGELQASANATVTVVAQPATLSGYVYIDAANDGSRLGDDPIPGVTVTLTGTDMNGPVSMTTTTDANGFYTFGTLLAGTYTITETQPAYPPYLDGIDTIGSLGGTVAPDSFTSIVLGSNQNGAEYNFGERQAGMVAGAVYVDTDNDGVKDTGESGISGVTVRLFTGTTLIQTTTTNSAGTYKFAGVAPGTYVIVETQPAAYLDGRDTVGTGFTTPGTVTNDIFSGIGVVATEAGAGYNFGEITASASATSTVSRNFVKTTMTAGDTLWFSSAFRAGGLTTVAQGDVTLRMVNSFITLTPKVGSPITIPTPDATIVFKNTLVGGATTTFDAVHNTWVTTLLKGTTNDWFLNAVPFTIPALPDLKEATMEWTGTFIVDTTGVDVSSWKAAAAEYAVAYPADFNTIGVKPTDNATPAYPNTDQAGVPENWKASFVPNTGTGGTTQPGAYSSNGNPVTQVLPAPGDATETFQTTPVVYP